jgi:hypothetical protein
MKQADLGRKLTSHSTISHFSENMNMQYVEASVPIGESQSPNLSLKLNQITAQCRGLLRNWVCVTTFGQVLYKTITHGTFLAVHFNL